MVLVRNPGIDGTSKEPWYSWYLLGTLEVMVLVAGTYRSAGAGPCPPPLNKPILTPLTGVATLVLMVPWNHSNDGTGCRGI